MINKEKIYNDLIQEPLNNRKKISDISDLKITEEKKNNISKFREKRIGQNNSLLNIEEGIEENRKDLFNISFIIKPLEEAKQSQSFVGKYPSVSKEEKKSQCVYNNSITQFTVLDNIV